MASGHMNRVKRPDTWLHRPMLQNVKKVLANPEPSTHDPFRKSATFKEISIAPPQCLPTVTLPPLIFEGGAMVEGSSIGFQLLSESVE
jgi:hypothetical protein